MRMFITSKNKYLSNDMKKWNMFHSFKYGTQQGDLVYNDKSKHSCPEAFEYRWRGCL